MINLLAKGILLFHLSALVGLVCIRVEVGAKLHGLTPGVMSIYFH